MGKIEYRKLSKYKYQLLKEYRFFCNCPVQAPAEFDFLQANGDGFIVIKKGYAWDGPSGPTIDTENFMRGALVHDSLYQLIREGCINIDYRDHADRLLQEICLRDGMSRVRAWYVYQAVKWFAKSSAIKNFAKSPAIKN